MTKMTAHEAWEGFVGSQTPAEFMEVSRQKLGAGTTIEQAVAAYVEEIPAMFGQSYTELETIAIYDALVSYIRERCPQEA